RPERAVHQNCLGKLENTAGAGALEVLLLKGTPEIALIFPVLPDELIHVGLRNRKAVGAQKRDGLGIAGRNLRFKVGFQRVVGGETQKISTLVSIQSRIVADGSQPRFSVAFEEILRLVRNRAEACIRRLRRNGFACVNRYAASS